MDTGHSPKQTKGARGPSDRDPPRRKHQQRRRQAAKARAIDAELVAAREAAVLDAPAGSGDAVCQELALLARTRFAKSPQLLAAFLAASGVLAREAPASFPRVARWRGAWRAPPSTRRPAP